MLKITETSDEKEQVYLLDDERLTIKESKLLYKFSGKNPEELFGQGDPEAVQGYLWLAKYRAGEQPRYSALEDVDIRTLRIVPCDENGDEITPDENGEEDDPAGNADSPDQD